MSDNDATTTVVDEWAREGLRPRHSTEYLIPRGVALDVARQRGYESVSSDDGINRRLPGKGWSASVQKQYELPNQWALTIPLFELDSRRKPQSWQIRLDTPRVSDGRKAKFETPGGGGRGRGEGLIPIPEVHPSQRSAVIEPSTVLVVTEGVVKGDSMISALHRENAADRFAVTSITGVWMGFESGSKRDDGRDSLMGAFVDRIPLDGRQVVLVWDADARSNPGVAQPLLRFARLLESSGAKVRVARIEPLNGDAKAGVDDHLAAGAAIIPILDDADPLASVAEELAKLGAAFSTVSKPKKPRPFENEDVEALLDQTGWLESGADEIWRSPGETTGLGAELVLNKERRVQHLRVRDRALAQRLGTFPKGTVDAFQLIAMLGCGGDWKAAGKLCARFVDFQDLVDELAAAEDKGLSSQQIALIGQPTVREAIAAFRSDQTAKPVEFELTEDEYGITTLVTIGGPNHGIRLRKMERIEAGDGSVTLSPKLTNLTNWVAWRSRVETTKVIDSHGIAQDAGTAGKVTIELVRRDGRMYFATAEADRLTSLDRILNELDAGVAGPSLPKHDRFVMNALRQFAFDEQERTALYTSTGWTTTKDRRCIYLAGPRGGISAFGIVTPDEYRVGAGLGSEEGSLTPFQESMGFDSLPETHAELRAAAESIKAFVAIAAKRPDLGVAVLGALWAGPLRMERRAAVMIAAEPGAMKSAYLSRVGGFFSSMEPTGSDFAIDIDGASQASASSTALWHVDATCLADDFRLDSSAKDNDIKRGTLKLLAQGSYSGAARQRATQQGGNRSVPKRRDVTLITAEIPDGGTATLSRLVVVPIDRTTIAQHGANGGPAPIDDWVVDHALTGNARRAFGDYIRWLAETAEREAPADPLAWIREEADGTRGDLRQQLRHARAGEVVAVLATGWAMMRCWATQRGIDDLLPSEEEIQAALETLVASSAAETAEVNPGLLTMKAITELLESGRMHLTGSGGKEPQGVPMERVGWRWDPNADRGDGGWRGAGEHGGYIAIDSKRVVISSAGLQSARRAAGLGELKMAQIAAGLTGLVSKGTTPNTKIPAGLIAGEKPGSSYRPQGTVFDIDALGLADDETAELTTMAFSPAELAG